MINYMSARIKYSWQPLIPTNPIHGRDKKKVNASARLDLEDEKSPMSNEPLMYATVPLAPRVSKIKQEILLFEDFFTLLDIFIEEQR